MHAMSLWANEPTASSKGAVPAGHPGALAEALRGGGIKVRTDVSIAAVTATPTSTMARNLRGEPGAKSGGNVIVDTIRSRRAALVPHPNKSGISLRR